MGKEEIKAMMFKGHSISKQKRVEGEALVTNDLVAFWAGTDWETGEIVEVGHEARGQNMKGKILVFPAGKGGAGETFGYYYLYRSNCAPLAMVCNKAQRTTVSGAILTNTPMIYVFKENIVENIRTGDIVSVDGEKGEVEIIKKVKN
jgi:predicted aconitase with swiveling domain